MSEMSSAVTKADAKLTDFRAAQAMKTTSSAAVLKTAETGFVNNKTKSAVSNTMDKNVKPLLLKNPKVLALIAEIRSNNVRLSDVVAEASCLIQDMEQAGTSGGLHIGMLPNFIDIY